MRFSGMLMGGLALIFSASTAESASLRAKVDVNSQTMTVTRNGEVIHKWKVSTGRKGFATPSGTWKPKRMHRLWHSRKYDMAPMPYSVFYNGGYAVHGTYDVKRLGRTASHGCVRLSNKNAETFYQLVRRHGMANTRISIVR